MLTHLNIDSNLLCVCTIAGIAMNTARFFVRSDIHTTDSLWNIEQEKSKGSDPTAKACGGEDRAESRTPH